MRTTRFLLGVFALAVVALPASVSAQPYDVGTAFTYQGQLKDGGQPVTGTCDFEFDLYDAAAGGTQVGSTVSTNGVAVTNGLFAATVDFGEGRFTGDARWLGVAVQCAGDPGFTLLSPRQELTPAPYALYALDGPGGSSPWQTVGSDIYYTDGNVGIGTNGPQAVLHVGGTPGMDGVMFPDGTLQTSAAGGATDAWSLTGNVGTDVTVNFLGTTDDEPLVLRVNNQRALRIEPDSDPSSGFSPNLIGGYSGNSTTNGAFGNTIGGGGLSGYPNRALGQYGTVSGGRGNTVSTEGTVGGGGINTAGYLATVGGGAQNTASGLWAVVGGGRINTASESYATIGGGRYNDASGEYATVGGGYQNDASGNRATIGGGYSNDATGEYATVPGGGGNYAAGDYSLAAGASARAYHFGAFVWSDASGGAFASTGDNQFLIRASGGVGINTNGPQATLDVEGDIALSGWLGTTHDEPLALHVNSMRALKIEPVIDSYWGFSPNLIGGYGGNSTTNGVYGATISGGGHSGYPNRVLGYGGTVGGGVGNTASFYATVGGGISNEASDIYATVGGGYNNTAGNDYATIGGGNSNICGVDATVGGGEYNTAGGWKATVGGGSGNTASGWSATVGGGEDNTATNTSATVGGGYGNNATAAWATVPGGNSNTANGTYSFAAGRQAKALHVGAFVWGDSTNADFESTGEDQFLIRAAGGVGIGTNSPGEQLHVAGNVQADGNLQAETIYANGNVYVNHDSPTADGYVYFDAGAEYLRWDDSPGDFDLSDALTVGGVVESTSGGFKFPDATVQTTAAFGDGHSLDAADGDPVDKVYVANDGAVGVWTTSPNFRLHVKTNGGNGIKIQHTGTGNYPQIHWSDASDTRLAAISVETTGPQMRFFVNDSDKMTIAATGNVGIGRTPAANRLEVEGDASKTTAGDWLANSDARIKTDVSTITNALETLDKVRLVDFRYTDEYRAAHPNIADRRYMNVIAQEFQEVFPEYVKDGGDTLPDGERILQVDAYPLTVYSAAAVQELHAMVKEKNAEIATQQKQIAELTDRLERIEALLGHLARAEMGGAR